METMQPGQRWVSESEPELGLGLIVEVDQRHVTIFFPGGQEERRYLRSSAPLRRVHFQKGDTIEAEDGSRFVVESVTEAGGLLIYMGEGKMLPEVRLSAYLSTNTPETRLFAGDWDNPHAYQLREEVQSLLGHWRRSPVRGLVGGRMSLLPHQMFIAHEVTSRLQPRVLLADETGLGKTIEAGLILHRLLLLGRVQRVLILLPESLVHQWFVELFRRFSLVFRIVDESFCKADTRVVEGGNPFVQEHLSICSMDWLMRQPRRAMEATDAGWDLVIVDEAHHIDESGKAYGFLRQLAAQTPGVLLLTATPEQLGGESHFARLQLLDPRRYASFAKFQEQGSHYRHLATVIEALLAPAPTTTKKGKSALPAEVNQALKDLDDAELSDAVKAAFASPAQRESTIKILLDRYGVGRVMFRNTRTHIQGFPVREVDLVPAESTASSPLDPRMLWLLDFLRQHPQDKCLLICRTEHTATEIHTTLKVELLIDAALFHEGMNLLQRDRSAAWFQDPEGARLLICSEIGGEGRNFQSAQHLVLYDLPPDPELLEQRIGRLDRIGQADRIFIHVPYVAGTGQELWARWFHEGLDAFAANFPGGYRALQMFGEKLDALVEKVDGPPPKRTAKGRASRPKVATTSTSKALSAEVDSAFVALLAETKAFCEEVSAQLAAGRNLLLERSSFDVERAHALVAQVDDANEDPELWDIVSRLFDHFGVEVESLERDTWKLVPGIRLHESFPWLQTDAMRATFSRELALQDGFATFLSPDHPMVMGSIELMLGSQDGTCCVLMQPDSSSREILLECLFVAECVAPRTLDIERYLPPTPLRLVVNHHFEDVTEEYPIEEFEHGESGLPAQLLGHRALFTSLLPEMVKKNQTRAEDALPALIRTAKAEANAQWLPELERLSYLSRVNPDVSPVESALLQSTLDEILDALSHTRWRLDAVRLVMQGVGNQ